MQALGVDFKDWQRDKCGEIRRCARRLLFTKANLTSLWQEVAYLTFCFRSRGFSALIDQHAKVKGSVQLHRLVMVFHGGDCVLCEEV